MSTRSIRTTTNEAACDVCGRTLLRGERAEVYVGAGARHSVCELCTSRALHEGWVREGEMLEYDGAASRSERRRSLLGRLRARREPASGGSASRARRPLPPLEEPADAADGAFADPEGEDPAGPPPERPRRPGRGRPTSPSWPAPVSRAVDRIGGGGREPRHVRAVPTSVEHKMSAAVSIFNDSEHPRTVVGIARSLGLPDVAVHPSDANGIVNVVVAWELCWYRYEVDLSDEVPHVRVAAQGYELSELSELERTHNAVADDRGRVGLAG